MKLRGTQEKMARVLLGGAMLLSFMSTGVLAQSTGATAVPSGSTDHEQSAESNGAVQEIIVTARRREENLQTVPIAITVLSGETIRQHNIISPLDLNGNIPGLTVRNSGSSRDSADFYIRGQGEAQGSAVPGVITYFAEVPTISDSSGLLFDLKDVQVLKGPQGTLFGRNATGGAVIFEPQRPTAEFGGYAEYSGGEYNLRRSQGAINIPLVSDVLLIRFAFDINQRDGFTEDLTNHIALDNVSYGAYRLGVTFRPNNVFENYINAFYSGSDNNGTSNVLDAVKPGSTTARIYPNVYQLLAQQQQMGIRDVRDDPGLLESTDTVQEGVTNISTVRLSDNLDLKNIFGYRAYKTRTGIDIVGLPVAIAENIASSGLWRACCSGTPSQSQYSDELQLQGKSFDNQFTWIGGLYGESRQPWPGGNRTASVQYLVGALLPSYQFGHEFDDSYAVFAENVFDASRVIKGLKLTTGIRYTEDKRKFESATVASSAYAPYPNPPPSSTERAEFHAPTWNINLSYDITQRVMVYVANRRGYKTGGFNPPNAVSDTYQPEYLTDYEVGIKSTFDAGATHFRVNAAAFNGDYTNIQETTFALASSGNLVQVVSNAAKATIRGGEFELVMSTDSGVGLTTTYSYTDAKFNQFIGVQNKVATNFAGSTLPETPKSKVSTTLSYTAVGAPGGGSITLSGNYTYQSRMLFLLNEQNDPSDHGPGYGLVGLRTEWNEFLGHPIGLSAFVTNLTNKDYRLYKSTTWNEVGWTSSTWGEPRMWGVSLRYTF
jgi:iron complex outermembrane recepter protein